MDSPQPPWHAGRGVLTAWLLFAFLIGAALALLAWLFVPVFW